MRAWAALTTAQARDFVAAMPDGLDSPITQGGSNVSGGQRQRLAIARAIVRRADIVVFDDSFSALDVATDARLRAALAEKLRDTTMIIVAQRVATIMRADGSSSSMAVGSSASARIASCSIRTTPIARSCSRSSPTEAAA